MEFYRGIEEIYTLYVLHIPIIHMLKKFHILHWGISGKFSIVVVSSVGVMCIKLCNYLLIVSARATIWICVLYLKESRYYRIFEEFILFAVLSALCPYVFLNIVKMEFKFSVLVVVFL